ncbi:MAG TPA: hypothetical protein VF507_05735, partial [Pyrinomonadaceae bacterium]
MKSDRRFGLMLTRACGQALFSIALLFSCGLAIRAQQEPVSPLQGQQSGGAIARESILRILTQPGLTPEQRSGNITLLLSAIRASGVSFELTPAGEQELANAGATPELLAAIRASYRPASAAASLVPRPSPTPAERDPAMMDGKPSVTKHEIRIGGRVLRYTVTTGMMPLRSAAGETEARLFFVAYTADNAGSAAQRPLMFSFNGGPGSSSVWLHLGVLGPRRVKMLDDGGMPPPPFQLVDNEYTWLDQADMVFIDPVGTGYSRAAKPELAAKYFGLEGDIASVGEFIRLYLSRYERWSSPLFLVGESYGTTRAAGLSGYLIEKGVAFNGIILVSTVMSFGTIRFGRGNDLPFVLYLPTYAATAWYHKKLAPELQADLRKTLEEVERWAATDYAAALAKGDRL